MDNEFDSADPRDPTLQNSDDSWITDDDVKALAEEREIFGTDLQQQAERILQENLPAVVQSVVKLSRAAESENVRLSAAKYIIDRNLGKITDPALPKEDDPTRRLLDGVVVSD